MQKHKCEQFSGILAIGSRVELRMCVQRFQWQWTQKNFLDTLYVYLILCPPRLVSITYKKCSLIFEKLTNWMKSVLEIWYRIIKFVRFLSLFILTKTNLSVS